MSGCPDTEFLFFMFSESFKSNQMKLFACTVACSAVQCSAVQHRARQMGLLTAQAPDVRQTRLARAPK